MPISPSTEPPQATKLPPEGVRTAISLLLFLHFAAVALAICSGALPAPPLRVQLGQVPVLDAYAQVLNFDTAYMFHLTDDAPLDADHFVEIELDYDGTSTPAARVLRLPEEGLRMGARAERYRNLAVNVGRRLSDQLGTSEAEILLPYAISRKLLAENQVTSGKHRFRLRRLLPLTMEAARSVDPLMRDPRHPQLYQNAYEADVTFYRGDVQITQAAEALETSPVVREPQSP